jgi:beta-lactamase regulating signal transducer with metallopeptidase domain
MNSVMHIAGWTLIHFIWQGMVIGFSVATLLRLTERRSPNVRYLIACAGLIAMLTAPLGTAYLLLPIVRSAAGNASSIAATASLPPPRLAFRRTMPQQDEAGQLQATADAGKGTAAVRGISQTFPRPRLFDGARPGREPRGLWSTVKAAPDWTGFERVQIDRLLRVVTLVWCIGVAVLLGRMAGGWWQVRRLYRIAIATHPSRWQSACRRIAYRIGLPAAAHVVESTLVEVPTLVGWMRPVILLPVAAIAALTPGQVEAILAHELAHIRRHDYAINLLQTLAETLLFYHPAVWWLSNRIRIEREHCCDEIAVAVCGDAVGYARALAQLEAWRVPSTVIALAATGGPLLDRVRRILRVPLTEQPPSQGWAGTIVLTLLFTVGAGSLQHLSWISRQTHARASFDQPPPSPPEPPEPPVPPEPPHPPSPVESMAPPEPPFPVEAPEPPAPPRVRIPVPPVPPLPPIPPTASIALDVLAPAAPAPPAPPVPPAPPTPPAPPLPRADVQSSGEWQMKWSDGTSRFEVRLQGAIAFNDELTDVTSISEGGYLTLRDWSAFIPRTIEIRSSGGVITRRFYVAGLERPFDDEARRWLAEKLPVLVRRSGLGAEQRVKSILAKKGVSGVLDEIGLLGGDHVRRLYFNLLVDNARFDSTGILPVLLNVERQMMSDYERGQVLQHVASRVRLDQRGGHAYVRAMASMRSDYERRRALTALVAARPLPAGIADIALTGVGDMRSDYERSEVLRTVLASGTIDQPDVLFAAVGRMTSGYEKRRVLLEALTSGALSPDTKRGFLMATASIDSDYECGQVLMAYVKTNGVEAAVRQPFFAALRTIDSDYERRRVLTELAGKGGPSREVQQSVFDLVGTMRSDYDRAEVLLAFVNAHAVESGTRQAFVNAAERIRSAHDQNRVLAALVKAERR